MNRIISFYCLILFCGWSVEASETQENCLEREWNDIGFNNVTERQQQFDRAHDRDRQGGLFSCSGYITASELKYFIDRLKILVARDDISNLEQVIHFPLVVIHERLKVGDNPKVTLVNNIMEFSSIYHDLFGATTKEVVNCMVLENMTSIPMTGIEAAFGGIIIKRFSNARQLYITSISMDQAPMKKWIVKNCKAQ